MAANAGETKVKLWEGICYPENMRDDWQDEIDDILQVPFAYAVHDIDHDQKSKQRKTHAHVIVVWGGNTTRKAIINVLNRLSADGKKCCSSAEPINNIRHAYDYLIHDTASCRKKGKELYPVEARIEGNNFDIGQLEQLIYQKCIQIPDFTLELFIQFSQKILAGSFRFPITYRTLEQLLINNNTFQ